MAIWTRKTPDALTSSRQGRWAEELYAVSTSEQPLRAAMFTIEQLEVHAKALAGAHVLDRRPGKDKLLPRLADSERVIAECHATISEARAAGRRLASAGEWLLDNFYLIKEQIDLARRHFPPGYSRQLPRLRNSDRAGFPRIYDLVLHLISHLDGRVDSEALNRYIRAYQSVSHLTLGELWAVPIMLRLALIENLRRVSMGISWRRVHRDRALEWTTRINEAGERHDGAIILTLADMVRQNPPLSTAFVGQFTQSLQGRGPAAAFALTWLEQQLVGKGQTIEDAVGAESQSQAADQVSMANSIGSLRFLNATDWHEFVEGHSATEKILRDDPAGVYARMDFATRDAYRHVVEALSRRLGISEEEVAGQAVALAAQNHAANNADVSGHVGYMLVDDGWRHLERTLRGRHVSASASRRMVRGLKLFGYLVTVVVFSATAAIPLVAQSSRAADIASVVLIVCTVAAAWQCGVAIANWLVSAIRRPRALPRMDFEAGIPDECRTMVVVPTLLTRHQPVAEIIEGLERRHLANRDANILLALLTDFGDADREQVEGDDQLLEEAVRGIEGLNTRYGNGTDGRFFLFHRPRLYNEQEGCWMGRERKRGKLEDFNALLRGRGRDRFTRIVGNVGLLRSIRYVITLDTDTDLPWGTGWRLVAAAAHPLNRPAVDASGRRVVRGYAILQPRVGVSLRSSQQSRYSRLLAGDVGVDPYTRVVSDLYQDLFAEASYIGKGIYDVDAFRQLLEGRFPVNSILSHDLLESCYARAGQVSDVELLEDHPSRYVADVNRRHRWMRGDWQIAPWLGVRVRDAAGRRVPPRITALGWWKILDNLRRTFVAPACTILLALGWIALPVPVTWTCWVLGLLFVPELLPSLAELFQRPEELPWRMHLAGVGWSTARRLGRAALWLTFLPFEALVAADATVRSLWRMLYSRHHLLEWQTAAAAERRSAASFQSILRRMWIAPTVAAAAGAVLIAGEGSRAVLAASPVLLLWLVSPAVAWWVSRPLKARIGLLSEEDVRFLRLTARLTWRYFEDFVGPHEIWLPPDNFQEGPTRRIDYRTSPTNMGLALLSNLAAHDLGYVTTGQLLDRTSRMIDSMEQMERYRGHFYNWYDSRTRRPARGLYVSTVDSGNLVGHLRVLQRGLLELPSCAPWSAAGMEGLRDTFRVLQEHVGATLTASRQRARKAPPGHERAQLELAGRLLENPVSGLAAAAARLRDLSVAATRLAGSFDTARDPEAAWWAHAFDRQVRSFAEDLTEIAPWLGLRPEEVDGESRELLAGIDGAQSLDELGRMARQAAERVGVLGASDGRRRLVDALLAGAQRISSRMREADALAERCLGLADADFSFLYDKARKLLSIGYSVTDRRLDNGFYDLLASEARLASYAAIALAVLPLEHWFALNRRLTAARGRQVLLSWSGSMFEYLMPLLVMPTFEGTLLDQTYRGVVSRQIDYGRQRGVPWGISESCYNLLDGDGNYQYRAFGVPGLGLQRGLSDDVVVAPYASALALLVDPRSACANLRQMAEQAYLGPYGFYDAVDYTPMRVAEGQKAAIVQTFMAHHQGMSLLALGHAVVGPGMRRRFLANPEFRAAEMLLQERVPKAVGLLHPHAREARVSRKLEGGGVEAVMRIFTDPNTPTPEVHLLSNGRYHVMVSAAGGGYSRWHETALTRWREDRTCESTGLFCYVSDSEARTFWSSSMQPTLQAGRGYEAIFTQGRAEFRRQDGEVETHTEIAVSPEDDLEIRRIRLTNRSDAARSLVVTGYAEVVLAAGVNDELHRTFSNLFVQTELLAERNAILVTRRPRSAEERPPWMFCMLQAGTEVGPCSFETDRGLFIGRNRDLRRPAALDDPGPLSGTAGSVLDPCVAIRRAVPLLPERSAQLDIILGAAPTREAALAMVMKYQDHRMADRVFELATTYSRAILGHLGAAESQAQQFGLLASAVIHAPAACRAPAGMLRRNRKGQSGLWAYGISGDNPIVLLRVGDTAHLRLVRDVLMAHAYWRMKGLITDLVIWNEDVSGYRQELNDHIMGLIAAGTESQLLDKPGGIFVRHVDQFSEEDRVLVQAVARIVIEDANGTLDQQMERWRRASAVASGPLLVPSRSSVRRSAAVPARRDLIFFNGTGGFTADGREYVILLAPGVSSAAPWVNVISNPRFGTVISETGSAYTWFENAQLYRLTPWHNDPVSDPTGEAFYVRDDASGRFFSPMPSPAAGQTPYVCRHGFGYSIFEHSEYGLESQLTTYVGVNAPLKFLVLKLKNTGVASRTVSVFGSVDLVLGDLRSRTGMHVATELEPLTGAILARNSYRSDLPDAVGFFDCSEPVRTVTGDRKEFLGRNGTLSAPAAVRLRQLSGRLGPGLDPCAAMQVRLDLAAGAEREVVFILGAGRDAAEAVSLVQRYRGIGAARVALEEVWRFWNDKLGVIYAETPDAALNVLMNGWVPYQILSGRMWGRSGFYQSGGAYGFRDQLQDCVAILHEMPELARQHILRCAERQFVEGDVQHWWHPPGGRGVRTRCSDDYLWLAYAVCRYIAFTGDTGVLDEQVPFLTGRLLKEGEESYYDLPGRADQTGTLYEHCVQAISYGLKFGPHGLPLMGTGDWNDGMNRVGHLGRGESVWLAFFLHHVLSQFAAVAQQREDSAFAERCLTASHELARNIEAHGWDGQWYRRAFLDSGEPLGSAGNAECKIDSLPQSWAVISGAGQRQHCRQALDAVWSHLVQEDLEIVRLFEPPFEQSDLDPGYIKGYPPGVRENGGQYTHAAIWAALAYALAGRIEQAWKLVSMLNPIHHASDAAGAERYRVEPYVLAADVYAAPGYAGRGGWTWYTGSAGWFYRLLYEVLLGMQRQVDVMRFRPRVPASWREFKLHYRYYQTFYHIVFTQDPEHRGPIELTLDGQRQSEATLKLINDGQEHQVGLLFGPWMGD
jgi:cyclic beta-1,2-glucan synthetase